MLSISSNLFSSAVILRSSEASEEETVEAKEGFEAMLAASEKARKQLQLR